MARKIKTIVHERTGIEVILKLDVKAKQFEATYANRTYRHAEMAEVEKLVLAAIEEASELTFYPVIAVSVESPMQYDKEKRAGVDFSLDRYALSFGVDTGHVRKLDWHRYESGDFSVLGTTSFGSSRNQRVREKIMAGEPSSIEYYYRGEYEAILPYDEELWNKLQIVRRSLAGLYETGRSLIEECVPTGMLDKLTDDLRVHLVVAPQIDEEEDDA